MAAVLFVQVRVVGAQREPATPAEVINRYFQAVGDAQKSVVAMVKRGELSGDLTFVVGGVREAAHREENKYSEYRAFRVQTRIVPSVPKP